jgi:hypothetical protein
MTKTSKGFDGSRKTSKVAKLVGDEEIFWRVPKEKQLSVKSNWDERKKRIGEIIGFDDKDNLLKVNDETLTIYGNYLKKNLESPCYLTGSEDFSWEESYAFGYMSEKEHTERRKKRASYLDTFKLIEIIVDMNQWSEIGVTVHRMEDGKKFELSLSMLEATDRMSKNYQLINDYVKWYWNYR